MVRVALGRSRAVDVYDTIGLTQDEGQAVLDGIVAQAKGAPFTELGPGQLDVLWATSHPIDGSASGFNRLASSLIPLLALTVDADENAITHAWRRQDESVRIAKMGDLLTATLAGHPKRGVFHAGASEAELESLETSLGFSLPEPVRWMLRQVNGGSFVDDRPQEEEDNSEESCTYCDLLSTDEIRTELFDLIATHESAAEVDRWEGNRPINPRLRQLDGSLLPWPCLPIARTSEGREIVAVELSGAGHVIDAWHEVGPQQWRMVYGRYVDFIEDFMLQGGCIKAIGQYSKKQVKHPDECRAEGN